ncbi:hypothetical protein EBO15_11930 [Actinomadura harenae]|uniref:Uncharacterized protein n=2 Tax=Actinomadura harenae TaxID=2483351 RepID=A0A3M2M599_9ACTN|nr:hypothetical protein EBO15_11930 [Actinomadura harenae]
MSLKFTTPASGYGPVNVSPGTPGNPSFTNCGDNYARFWVAASAGTWTWTGASGPPPAMKIGVPGGGLTLTLSGLPGCTISARPTVITLTAGGAWFRVFNAPIQAAASPSCGIPGGVLTLGFSASLSPSTVVDIT